jgi:hypothetical protein
MRLSEGRISYLAHHIVATLKKEGLVEIESERHVLAEIKRAMERQHDREAEIDAIVRKKIASLSRNVPPGSREWDVLYKRYLGEEQQKRKT